MKFRGVWTLKVQMVIIIRLCALNYCRNWAESLFVGQLECYVVKCLQTCNVFQIYTTTATNNENDHHTWNRTSWPLTCWHPTWHPPATRDTLPVQLTSSHHTDILLSHLKSWHISGDILGSNLSSITTDMLESNLTCCFLIVMRLHLTSWPTTWHLNITQDILLLHLTS